MSDLWDLLGLREPEVIVGQLEPLDLRVSRVLGASLDWMEEMDFLVNLVWMEFMAEMVLMVFLDWMEFLELQVDDPKEFVNCSILISRYTWNTWN